MDIGSMYLIRNILTRKRETDWPAKSSSNACNVHAEWREGGKDSEVYTMHECKY